MRGHRKAILHVKCFRHPLPSIVYLTRIDGPRFPVSHMDQNQTSLKLVPFFITKDNFYNRVFFLL